MVETWEPEYRGRAVEFVMSAFLVGGIIAAGIAGAVALFVSILTIGMFIGYLTTSIGFAGGFVMRGVLFLFSAAVVTLLPETGSVATAAPSSRTKEIAR